MKDERVIRISVRNLVEFILRGRDIDNRVSGSMEKDAMLLGSKIHRRIQKSYGRRLYCRSSAKSAGRL